MTNLIIIYLAGIVLTVPLVIRIYPLPKISVLMPEGEFNRLCNLATAERLRFNIFWPVMLPLLLIEKGWQNGLFVVYFVFGLLPLTGVVMYGLAWFLVFWVAVLFTRVSEIEVNPVYE